jgi:DNA polymerase-4
MFVAVARLVDPEGAGRAARLVVGGSIKSRGVVCSASYEVRAFGVRAGMPIAQAARRCPDALFVPVPRKACSQKSREVRDLLTCWAPIVEAASIDEFYLDLSGTEAVYRNEPLEATAARIRTDLMARTGLRFSIGGGTNRLIAKLAAERAKPRPGTAGTGVLVIAPGEEAEFLATHALEAIPGIGPRLQVRLKRYGLVSVQDALRVERSDFVEWLGDRTGAWLYDRIRGRGHAKVVSDADAKSMSHEETFARDLAGDEELEVELLHLATRLAAEVRHEELRAARITIKLRDFDFTTRSAARTLSEPTDSDRALFTVGRELLARLRARRRVPARLLGIAVSRFSSGARAPQLELLEPSIAAEQRERDRTLARVKDQVAKRFGPDALQSARLAARQRRPWETRIEAEDGAEDGRRGSKQPNRRGLDPRGHPLAGPKPKLA